MAPFDETLRSLMAGKLGTQKLSNLTNISKSTLDAWQQGRVQRPRDWRLLLRVAQALLLSTDEANALLASWR
jgi:DNA-binding transcriptional regulator YiaG